MSRKFHSFPLYYLDADATYAIPGDQLPSRVTSASPAIDAMTDLRRVAAVTVDANTSINTALERMRTNNVRLLIVVSREQRVLGIVTATDIQGDRPLRFQREVGVNRDEILVRDIMTPRERLEAIRMEDVVTACVGDVIETLKRAGRQHALAVEYLPTGPCIRGIFSSTRIGRQLGVTLPASGIARTFAELEVALTH